MGGSASAREAAAVSKTDLQEVLDEFGAEGQWDSQDSFTPLSGKALSKLAAYQLPRPTAWILKLVQAAAAASCLRVRFDPNPNLTDLVVTFVGGELGTLEQLADIWTSPTATVTLAQKHLLVGLRAVSVSKRRDVRVRSVDQQGVRFSLHWNGSGLSEVSQASRSYPRREALISFSIGPDPQRGHALETELAELRAYAAACPIPLLIGNETLEQFGMADLVLTRKPLLSCTIDETASWTLYRHTLQARGVLCWVQHGAVCQEEELGDRDQWQIRLLRNVDYLETDITGLHLRVPEHLTAKAVVSPLVRRATEQMLSDRSMIPEAVKVLFGNETFGFWSVMAMAVVLSATLAPAISYFGFGIGAVGALGFHSLFRKNRKSDLRETQAALQQWCERQHTHHFAAEQTRSSEQ